MYSQENNGLLWADEKNLIHWIDLSTWEDLRIIATGAVGGQNRTAENTGLLILLNPEPETLWWRLAGFPSRSGLN